MSINKIVNATLKRKGQGDFWGNKAIEISQLIDTIITNQYKSLGIHAEGTASEAVKEEGKIVNDLKTKFVQRLRYYLSVAYQEQKKGKQQ